MLASSLRKTLNASGSCQTKIDNQLKTIDDFTLTIESIKVSGSTATARVQSEYNGSKVIQPVKLVDQKAGWRISSVGSV